MNNIFEDDRLPKDKKWGGEFSFNTLYSIFTIFSINSNVISTEKCKKLICKIICLIQTKIKNFITIKKKIQLKIKL